MFDFFKKKKDPVEESGKLEMNKEMFLSTMKVITDYTQRDVIKIELSNDECSIFDSKLLNTDTYLDDLAIGLYVSKYIDKRYISDKILGSEAPNNTFMGLVLQRWRWGIGYSTLLLSIWDNSSYRRRLLIHGFAYHFLWIIIWFLCYIFFEINIILGLIYLGVISFIISKPKNLVFYSFIYEIVFPIFHIVWGISVINTIIRGRKHNECL